MGYSYRFRKSDVDAFENSAVLTEFRETIKKIGRLIGELSPDDQHACQDIAEKYLRMDEERKARLIADVVDEEEIALDQREENEEIAIQIERWFPFLRELTEDERSWYASAFLEHFSAKRRLQ